jgi:hypothetical protein
MLYRQGSSRAFVIRLVIRGSGRRRADQAGDLWLTARIVGIAGMVIVVHQSSMPPQHDHNRRSRPRPHSR